MSKSAMEGIQSVLYKGELLRHTAFDGNQLAGQQHASSYIINAITITVITGYQNKIDPDGILQILPIATLRY